MNIDEELNLFSRYTKVYGEEHQALIGVASVHLAQQLERYINPSLDLGWVIRYILDINSNNLFTNSRVLDTKDLGQECDQIHPEFNYAKFIIELTKLFILVSESKTLDKDKAKEFLLPEESKFYFGEHLAELNDRLIQMVCPELPLTEESELA